MREMISSGLKQLQLHGAAAALPYFEKAALLGPTSHLPLFMLGNATSELGDLDAAAAFFSRARDLKPDEHVIRFNLGLHNLWRGYIDAAIEELGIACRLNPKYLPARSTYLMALHSSDRVSPENIAEATGEWGRHFAQGNPASARSRPSAGHADSDSLRVGFVSGDFRTHSVAHFFEPIICARDPKSMVYFLYNNSPHSDQVTSRLRTYVGEWRDISRLTDAAVIEQIRADRIDILVDLSGHTAFNRLTVFARRAAPVQVSYLGYPGSTGLPTMDYRIADAATDPAPFADAWHTETLLRLTGSQWCFRPFGIATRPGPLPARQSGFVTFGSFNSLSKASDTLLRCWTQILLRSRNSRLRLSRIRSPQRAAEIVAALEKGGVHASRVVCVAEHAEPPHGAQYAGVDIGLDHYPYNGVTTTCESLYAGIPVVSLHGRNCSSRSGLSILGSVGLGELVASTPEQYVEIAATLADDLPRLEQLRASLPGRFDSSSLRDEKRFSTDFEELLRNAWSKYVEQGFPTSK